MKLLEKILERETGQALSLALVLLLFGGFFVIPCLALMSTSLNAVRMVDQTTLGLYAADSGVEYALSQIKNTVDGPPASQTLGENVNSMSVEVVTNEVGAYTLYADDLITLNDHAEYLEINGNMEYVDGNYKYTITLTITEEVPGAGEKIFIQEIGAKLPAGYAYEAESAALFPDNLYDGQDSEGLPNLDVAADGAQMINWVFPTPRPFIRNAYNETVTQTFYLTGSGEGGGDYAWVLAAREDIGAVSEISGTLYAIASTASLNGEITAIVDVVVLGQGSGIPYSIQIASWEVAR